MNQTIQEVLEQWLCDVDPNCRLDGEKQSPERSMRENEIIQVYEWLATNTKREG